MNARDDRPSRRLASSPVVQLLRRVGRAGRPSRVPGRAALSESLEPRVLLAVDHPSFSQVFNTPTPAAVTAIVLDGGGAGSVSGVVNFALDNDIVRFTAPADDFVTVWADTINEETGVSVLNSRVEVYTRSGPNNTPTLVGSGAGNDSLTGGVNTDGWFGFVATAGQEYFIRIRSDATAGSTATGAYVARVDAITSALDGPISSSTGEATASGEITLAGSDIVYRVDTLTEEWFNSVATANGTADDVDFDSRLDVYDSTGQRIRQDSESGRLSNAFLVFGSAADATFFVRVRSDNFSPTQNVALGEFVLVLDLSAAEIEMDPVTRRGSDGGAAGGQISTLARFRSEGTGLGIITLIQVGLIPIPDPNLRIYNGQGALIGFNDDYAGVNSQVEIQLTGGVDYFVVVEDFDDAGTGTYALYVESNHTFNPTIPWDDHQTTPDLGAGAPAFGTPEYRDIRRLFEQATPMVWGNPFYYLDPAGNPLGDRAAVVQALGTGRIHTAGDTDLFQFIPPIDMLGNYQGDNDDAGTSLYAGGAFTEAGTLNSGSQNRTNRVAAWDAGNWWPARRGLDGPVYAMAVFDEDLEGPLPPSLFVTGDFLYAGNTDNPNDDIFVNHLARFAFDELEGDYLWSAVGNGLPDVGRALFVFDGDDPDEGGPAEDPDPMLYMGGDFAQLFTWDGQARATVTTHNGAIYAMSNVDLPDPDGNGPLEDPPIALIVGGEFTTIGGAARNNIASWIGAGQPWTALLEAGQATNGTDGPVYALAHFDPDGSGTDFTDQLLIGGDFDAGGTTNSPNFIGWIDPGLGTGPEWQPTGGTDGPVYATVFYDIGLAAGDDPIPGIAVGGDFAAPGENIALWDGGALAPLDVGGTDGPVYSLAVMTDDDVGVGDLPVLYLGGSFTMFGGVDAINTAKYEFDPVFGVFFADALGWGPNDTVYALAEFDDGNPLLWDRNDRPSTRPQIVVQGVDGSFLNTFTRIYDSNFNLIYENETIAPPFPDPSGSLDPSLTIADLGELEGPPLWGGEVYYIEISGTGTGRYQIDMTLDAFMPDHKNSTMNEPPEGGDWGNAVEISIPVATGDARNFLTPVNAAHFVRPFVPTGSEHTIVDLSELGAIETWSDQDLFFFRAPSDGTAEIRLVTTQIGDEFVEIIDGAVDTQETSTLNSPLDGLIRIFNNDFEQIALADDSPVVTGEMDATYVGSFTDRNFRRHDPRVVFNVLAGEVYFVQIEGAQAAAIAAGQQSEVDWRRVTGGYELLINTMPNLSFDDDHEDTNGNQATVIPIDEDLASAGNGTGSVRGVIDHTNFNPADQDLFAFIAPGDGVAQITVTPDPGASLGAIVQVFDEGLNLVGQGTAGGVEPVTVEVIADQGAKFIVLVGALNASEGAYTLSVSDIPYVDDHGGWPKWTDATEIPVGTYDYDGLAEVDGSIETPGDVDIFRFRATTWDLARFSVAGAGTLAPTLRVYEVSVDLVGNPILLTIGSGGNVLNVPLTSPDRTTPITGSTYNYYYVVVQASDPDNGAGTYTLTIETEATDDHPDATQYEVATGITIDSLTGLGADAGELEVQADSQVPADTDLFRFTSPAQGQAVVRVTSPSDSTLRPRVRIFDQDLNPVADIVSGFFTRTGADVSVSTAQFTFFALRNQVYYIQVEGVVGGVVKTTETGGYTVGVTAPTLDDHANENEFPFASEIVLSGITGDGVGTGVLETDPDNDLFTFTRVAVGDIRVSISTPASQFTPVVRFFDGTTAEIGAAVTDGGAGDEDGVLNGTVVRTLAQGGIGDRFYVLVDDVSLLFSTGGYTVTLDGPEPIHDPSDDHADIGEFNDATLIFLSALTGDGGDTGGIQFAGDTDIFTFTSLAGGRAFVQVVTPAGQALDLAVRIFDATQTEIAFDSAGVLGANADVTFDIDGANSQYWIVVDPLTSPDVGDYTVRIDTQPDVHYLYFPEGFAGPNIREYVSVANANTFDVTMTIRIRYEDGSPETIVANNVVVPAGRRGGATISNASATPSSGARINTPYAVIIESDGPLAATFAHYDFGISLGEAFTGETSSTWTFARGERFPGAVRDFLLVYNPNTTDSRVTLTAWGSDGSSVAFSKVIGAGMRGGWAFNQLTDLPLGSFAFSVASEAADGQSEHIGVVASLSHYDLSKGAGYSVLGDPDGGSTVGVIPGITQATNSEADVAFFNNTGTDATVTITGKYLTSGLPDITRILVVPAHTGVRRSGADLGLVNNLPIALHYVSDQAITVMAAERKFNDANATHANTRAGREFFFGDGFISVPRAGTQYFEDLYFYNPDQGQISVTVTIYFSNGDQASTDVDVGAQDFSTLALHDLDLILDRGGPQFFSIGLTSASPFAATMTHYDLFLDGGWGTKGAPVGLLTPLFEIEDGIGG